MSEGFLQSATTADWGPDIVTNGSIDETASTVTAIVPKAEFGVRGPKSWIYDFRCKTNCLCPANPVSQFDGAQVDPHELRYTFIHGAARSSTQAPPDASDGKRISRG